MRWTIALLLSSFLAACGHDPAPADAHDDATQGIRDTGSADSSSDAAPVDDAYDAGAASDVRDAGSAEAGSAGVVVQFSDGTVRTACVPLPTGVSNSFDMLTASSLGAVTDGTSTVCKIGADGCDYPTQSCLCQCSAPCRVWGLYRLSGGQWVAAGGNPATNAVHSGDVDGWAWGMFSGMTGPPLPPALSFAQVCPGP